MERFKKENIGKVEKTLAIEQYREACNKLASITNKHLFDGSRSWYWVGDMVGDVCDFNGVDFLSPDEMVQILENDMTHDEYAEWREANLDNRELGYINLRSWMKGCRHEMLRPRKQENVGPEGKEARGAACDATSGDEGLCVAGLDGERCGDCGGGKDSLLASVTRIADNAEDVATSRQVLTGIVEWFKSGTVCLMNVEPFNDEWLNIMISDIFHYMKDGLYRKKKEQEDAEPKVVAEEDKSSTSRWKCFFPFRIRETW